MVAAFLMYNPYYKKGRKKGEYGNFNGYVAFKEELPYQRGDCLNDLITVHGGITFDAKSLWKESSIIPLTAIPEDIHKYRIIGFDTCHLYDTVEYWTFERTKEETLKLKEQIETLIKNKRKKYVLISFPEIQNFMEHSRFNECILCTAIEGHPIEDSTYAVPEDLYWEVIGTFK